MRIGVIADTHIPRRGKVVPEQVLHDFRGVDLILHAGDLTIPVVLDQLGEIAPVIAVAGNNDPPELAERLGYLRLIEAEGRKIGLVHGHLGTAKVTVLRALGHFRGVDCVVFGHSHIPYCHMHGNLLAFNPGSATDRRRSPTCTYGLLHISGDGLRGEIRTL